MSKLTDYYFKKRICPLCKLLMPASRAVYHADLGLLVCQGKCSERIDGARRVYDKSERGRWRPRKDVLAELGLR